MSNLVPCSIMLELLGTFRLTIAGERVPMEGWKSKKALLLLKYLATRYAEKIPSDVLIETLWPDSDYETATHTLHTTVYYLRKTLRDYCPPKVTCPDWIKYANGLYWLDVSKSVSIDLETFLKLNHVSEELEDSQPDEALELGLHALQLYRGVFLPEDMYLDWAEAMRETCLNAYVEMTLRTSRLLVQCHEDYKSAADLCRNAIGYDPYREDLYHMLIRCLITMGRLPEAVLQYNKCVKVLREEFDLEPCAKMIELLQEIKQPGRGKRSDTIELSPDGTFACDRFVFKAILGLEQRRAKRTKQPVVIMTISFTELDAKKYLDDVFSTLSQSMRRGDAITKWSSNMLAVLLTGTDEQGAAIALLRMRAKLGATIAAHCVFTNHILSDDHLSFGEFVAKEPAGIVY